VLPSLPLLGDVSRTNVRKAGFPEPSRCAVNRSCLGELARQEWHLSKLSQRLTSPLGRPSKPPSTSNNSNKSQVTATAGYTSPLRERIFRHSLELASHTFLRRASEAIPEPIHASKRANGRDPTRGQAANISTALNTASACSLRRS